MTANLGSAEAGSKPAHEPDAAPGRTTPGDPLPGIFDAPRDEHDADVARAVWKGLHDLGALLGISREVRTWRRLRDELATLREALHIEGEQTATEAARGLEDVAARVLEQHEVTDVGVWCEPCGGEVASCPHEDGWLVCSACGKGASTFDAVSHAADCLLALAWRALGKPGAVGDL